MNCLNGALKLIDEAGYVSAVQGPHCEVAIKSHGFSLSGPKICFLFMKPYCLQMFCGQEQSCHMDLSTFKLNPTNQTLHLQHLQKSVFLSYGPLSLYIDVHVLSAFIFISLLSLFFHSPALSLSLRKVVENHRATCCTVNVAGRQMQYERRDWLTDRDSDTLSLGHLTGSCHKCMYTHTH